MNSLRLLLIKAVVIPVACVSSAMPLNASTGKVTPADMIALFEKLNGPQPGHRKAHAHGVCAEGTFTPYSSEEFSGAPLISSGRLNATARFSLGSGRPVADERTPGTRGIGLQLSNTEGVFHVFTGNNFPVFAGKDPDTFMGLILSRLPGEDGKVDPKKFERFVAENPSVLPHLEWQRGAKTPTSYTKTQYFGLHTFFFRNGDKETMFRWELVPEAGVYYFSESKLDKMGSLFLEDRLNAEVEAGSAVFTLVAVIGQEGDSITDPSSHWPAERQRVRLGEIVLTSAGGELCTPINFDPMRVSEGFVPSDDPVLRMRSAAYAISFAKRLSNQ